MKKKSLIILCMVMLTSVANSTVIYAGILDALFGKSESTTTTTNVKQLNMAEEAFDWWQKNCGVEYSLNNKAKKFLHDHEKMFVGTSSDREKAKEYVDDSITWKKIQKDDSLYGDKIILRNNMYVSQIRVQDYDNLGNKYTSLILIDQRGNESDEYYYVLYYGEIDDDILDHDYVDFTGLPLGRTHFDNTKGGQTLVVAVAGCEVVKSGSKKLEYKKSTNNAKGTVKKTSKQSSLSNKTGKGSTNITNKQSADYIDKGSYSKNYYTSDADRVGATSDYVVVNSPSDGYANIRYSPSLDSDIKYQWKNGVVLDYLGETIDTPDGRHWHNVGFYYWDDYDGTGTPRYMDGYISSKVCEIYN